MLKIHNYYKLFKRPVGNNGWSVAHVSEEKDSYEIKLMHPHLSSVKIYLHRNLEETVHGKWAYFFKYHNHSFKYHNYESSGFCVTKDYIEDINNMLNTLENFTITK